MNEFEWTYEIDAPTLYVGQKFIINDESRMSAGSFGKVWGDGCLRFEVLGVDKYGETELMVLENTMENSTYRPGQTKVMRYDESVKLVLSGYWRET